MKQTTILGFGLAALLSTSLLTACSQDDTAAVANVQQEENKTVTVKELTERLRTYNASVYGMTRASQDPWVEQPELGTDNKMKIVVADVKGGIRGFRRGGWLGGLIGAAVGSLAKAITDWLFDSSVVVATEPRVFQGGTLADFSDSIGFYHNRVEARMYNMNNRSDLMTSIQLLDRADSIMLNTSIGYKAAPRLTAMQKAGICADLDVLRSIDTSDMTFDDYCDKLIELNPEDEDYINFVAEYLYIVNYANVDIDEYTDEVMFMINNANADVEDASLLFACMQVAYASTLVANDN